MNNEFTVYFLRGKNEDRAFDLAKEFTEGAAGHDLRSLSTISSTRGDAIVSSSFHSIDVDKCCGSIDPVKSFVSTLIDPEHESIQVKGDALIIDVS